MQPRTSPARHGPPCHFAWATSGVAVAAPESVIAIATECMTARGLPRRSADVQGGVRAVPVGLGATSRRPGRDVRPGGVASGGSHHPPSDAAAARLVSRHPRTRGSWWLPSVCLRLLPCCCQLRPRLVPLNVPCVLHLRFSEHVHDLRLNGSPCLRWFVAGQRSGHQPHDRNHVPEAWFPME